ncbi:MAG: energy transducer TonB [Acidobacteria bacterium]|nr:energy transducer TonB [Acidobacteriota bacterium]
MRTSKHHFALAVLLIFGVDQTKVIATEDGKYAGLEQQSGHRVLSEKELLSLVKKRIDPIYSQESMSIITRPGYGVFVSIEVNNAGKVIAARGINGSSLLKDAAIEAAKAWEFSPISGDEAVISGVINFGLPENYVRRDANHKLEQYEEDVQKILLLGWLIVVWEPLTCSTIGMERQ